jgi:agmatine/peptidylarginine deiminase
MNKFLLKKAAITLLLIKSLGIFAQSTTIPVGKIGIGMNEVILSSNEEIDRAKSKGIEIQTISTSPPAGQLRPVAEFEPTEAVLICYPFFIPMSLIKEMAKDIKVITIVANTSEQNTVLSQYTSNDINIDNCEFLIAPTYYWHTRDYGPFFIAIDNSELAIYDFTFVASSSPDNMINTYLADYLSMNRYASDIKHTGGNFMTDGIRMAASTTVTFSQNQGYTQQQLEEHFLEYMGIEEYHFMQDPILPFEFIQHIDCWAKFLSPNKVMVAQVPPATPNYNKFEAAANYFASLTSSWGMPFEVYRVFTPNILETYQINAYTNSLILNNKVFVPTSGNQHDAAAIETYKQAMPGYEIIGINYHQWGNIDALHCRTKEIADRCMLYIKHQPYFGEIENTGSMTFNTELYSYCNNTIYSDSVFIYLRVAGGDYEQHLMQYSGNNTWEVTIYGLPGDLIEYYVFAADESGRRECHPYIGAPDPHKFTLMGTPPTAPVLSLDKTSSSVSSDGFEIIEDYITVSNLGNAELIIEISDIDFSEMITITPLTATVQADDSQIIILSYNFAGIENGEYSGSFKLLSNDPENPVTEISLHACQNYLKINNINASDLIIYPNPASDKINIYFNDKNSTKVYIYNILGIQAKEMQLSNGVNSIDIKELPNGVYFIKIEGRTYKFVKN